MENSKIYPAHRVTPIIEQIRELSREAAQVPGAEEMVVVDKTILEALYAAALDLERNTPSLCIGLHSHGEGVSLFAFAVDPFIPFGQVDFQEYLEDTFEPWRDEHLDVETSVEIVEIRTRDAGRVAGAEPKKQEVVRFRNQYKCPNCGNEWDDVCGAQPDDDCGECGSRHIMPYASDKA